MAADLAREIPSARALLERADSIVGYPLSKIMSGERGAELNRTVYTQPAVFVHSMAVWEIIRERFPLNPSISAGHSLGEYSALCASGVLDFETALEIICVRAKAMDEAQPPGTCGMAAVVGLTAERVCEIVAGVRGAEVLEPANFNAPDQVVISGHLEAVRRAVDALAGEKRSRAVMLPVSSAFHTSLMEPARNALSDRLARMSTATGLFPVVSNVTARPHPASDIEIKQLLIDQVVHPVKWTDCIRTMLEHGAGMFVEVGPGKVLTGLLKRIERSTRAISVSDLDGLNALRGAGA